MSELVLENENKLPQGWDICKIDELTKSRKIGIDRSRREQFDNGIPYLKMNNITINGKLDFSSLVYIQCTKKEATDYQLEFGDILFNTRNSHELVGKTALWNNSIKNCVYNNNIMRLQISNKTLAKFLVYFMNSYQFKNLLFSLKKSTTNISAIYDKDLKIQIVPIPPLNEQKRIVEKIEELFSITDSALEIYKKSLENFFQIKSSILHYAFNDSNILFDIKTINDVFKIIDYRGRTPPYATKGIPHLRSNNVKNGQINQNKLKFISKETYEKFMTRGIPQSGDLLLTTEAPLGEISHIPNYKFSVAQRLIILRSLEHDSKFLMYQIMSPEFNNTLTGKKTGTTVTGISSKNFKPMKIKTTDIITEGNIANNIEKQLSQLDHLFLLIQKNMKFVLSFKNSILKQAFEGKLVPQNPNDPPASELLKQIKEEKEQLKQKEKSKKRKKIGR